MISIHAPRTGSDPRRRGTRNQRRYFNPRSPHGERRFTARRWTCRQYFNPRSPHGERLRSAFTVASLVIFQSTLPARGATRKYHRCRPSVAISIHAPRTGSDTAQHPDSPRGGHFNPRSPHGERHGLGAKDAALRLISIHAPRTGSDSVQLGGQLPRRHFNPRSPHGERPTVITPAAGDCRISIHAPRTGSDTKPRPRDAARTAISIHAPRTGSDADRVELKDRAFLFQSTLPARGATILKEFYLSRCIFQSTLPARGATPISSDKIASLRNFNPRSPHGERR